MEVHRCLEIVSEYVTFSENTVEGEEVLIDRDSGTTK
jgi:hypothetical protein